MSARRPGAPAACLALAALSLAALAAPSRAQTTWPGSVPDPTMLEEARAKSLGGPGSVSPLPGPVDPALYRVGPGDVLQVAMWGKVSRSDELMVGPEGTLLVPGAGIVEVAGLTLAEAREKVLERVKREVKDVRVDVRLLRPRRFLVSLTGEVKAAGPVEVSGTSRVSDVLPPSNLTDAASHRHIEVLDRTGKRTIADLELFFRTGDPALNPYLNDGDVVQVPVATEFVYAAGALARPGRFELGPRDSLRTLLRIAGDPLPSASDERVLLIRWTEPFRPDSLWLSLGDIYSGRQNPPLHDGERIYLYFVPQYHEQREVGISGEISRPGNYPIVENVTRISDLVRAAGGFLPTADLSAVRLRRPNPAAAEKDPELDRMLRLSREQLTATEYEKMRTRLAGLREEYRLDWTRVVQEGETIDLLLRNGDEVAVDRLVSSIRIDGEVRRPAILQYRPGFKVGDYVKEAGGYTDRAWKGKVRVTRAVTGQTLLASDVPSIDPGDFVWVPEKNDITAWELSKDVLLVLTYFATIVIAYKAVFP